MKQTMTLIPGKALPIRLLKKFMQGAACLLCASLLTLCSSAQTTGRYSGPWELEVSESTAGLRGVHAVGGGVVWASGTDGAVLRSEDSGYEWQPCTLPQEAAKLDFRAIWAWDAQTAMAMASGPGSQSHLYETKDGCTTWKSILTNAEPTGFWDGLLFFDRQHAKIYGDPLAGAAAIPLQTSADGGQTWLPSRIPEALPRESSYAASNSAMTALQGSIWLGTSKARVFRSRDGVTWQSTQTPLVSGNDSSGVFSLAFRDRKHGMAVGGDYRKPEETHGTAAYTTDGGAHWTAARKPPHGFRSAVAWDAQNNAWIAAGTNGTDISYDDGETWQWLDSGNWNALSLPWIVGPHGQIGKLGTLPPRAPAGPADTR